MALHSKILATLRKILPPISQVEQEALESGTVGWDREIISGHPNWDVLFELKKPELTPAEQAFLDGPTEELCKMLNNWEIQKENDLPKPVWDFIKNQGFMGLEIPTEYGGKGFSAQAHSAIIMKIASRSTTGAVTVMVPNSLGPAKLIEHYGTKEQQDHYLPRLASGVDVPCFALTGPEAGSDAGAIPDKGIVCRNEKGELGLKLTFEKRYITLGPVATLIGIAFKMEDPDGLLGGKRDLGITVAIVPRDTPGVDAGDRHKPMDLPFQNGPLRGKDVFIPLDNIIGGVKEAGNGWKMLMEALAVGRALSLPALSVAASKLSSHITGSYSRIRRQFSSPIGEFKGIEEPLARMAGLTYMMDAARLATVQMVDQKQRPAIASGIVKYHLTENMRKVVNDAMDVHGGKAISNGPSNMLADVYKGVPVAITVEGANIITRTLMIFGQGSVRAHPYILKVMGALSNKDEKAGFKTLLKVIPQFAWNTMKSFVKTFALGMTKGWGSKSPVKDKDTKKYYQQVNRLSAAFNLVTDTSMATLGGALKREERVTGRLGDVYSNLYLASCVLWHYEQQGRPKEDLPLVNWACTYTLNQAEKSLVKVLKTYPKPLIGKMLEPVIFPRGLQNKTPTDQMEKLAADTIRNPGIMREKMAAGIFRPSDMNEQMGMLEDAFQKSVATEGLEKTMSRAVKKGVITEVYSRAELLEKSLSASVITAEQFQQLKDADVSRRAIVMVDSFESEHSTMKKSLKA